MPGQMAVTAAPDPTIAAVARDQTRARRGVSHDVTRQIDAIRAAIAPLLAVGPQREAFWSARWETYVLLAAARVTGNRTNFYRMRAVAVIASVVVPAVVGLNLAGTGGVCVRWGSFALSLIAAVATATIALFRFGDRWFLYRDLQNALLACGWSLATDMRDPDVAWATFTKRTTGAIETYNGAYEMELVAAARGGNDKAP